MEEIIFPPSTPSLNLTAGEGEGKVKGNQAQDQGIGTTHLEPKEKGFNLSN